MALVSGLVSPTASLRSGSAGASAAREWIVVVHGGAGDLPEPDRDAHRGGCVVAAHSAATALRAGATPLDAAALAVAVLEDDPRFNAGTGGALTEDETLELDASVMRGSDLAAGAVAAMPPFKNPVHIARMVLDDGEHVLYAGAGAAKFALARGVAAVDPGSMVTDAARAKLRVVLARRSLPALLLGNGRGGGTVGAVCMLRGSVAAATSTGGRAGKRAGRVGDSPIIGAGTYADDASGACSATGDGELFLRACVAYDVTSRMERGVSPENAAREALTRMIVRTGLVSPSASLRSGADGGGGVIAVSAGGAYAFARTTETMTWAAMASDWDDARSGS